MLSIRKEKLIIILLAVYIFLNLFSCGGGSNKSMNTMDNLTESSSSPTSEPSLNDGISIEPPPEEENPSGEQENNQTILEHILSDFVKLKKVEIEVNVDKNSSIIIQTSQRDTKQAEDVYARNALSLEFFPCLKSPKNLNTYICTVYLKEDSNQEVPVIVTYKFKLFNLVYVKANQEKVQTILNENTTETLKKQGIIKAVKIPLSETSSPISYPDIPNTNQTEQHEIMYIVNTYKLNSENNSDNFIYDEYDEYGEEKQYSICVF